MKIFNFFSFFFFCATAAIAGEITADYEFDPQARALFFAAHNQNLHGLEVALLNGVSPDKQDIMGDTALHFAAKYNNLEMAHLLARYNAEADIPNYYEKTPLNSAQDFPAMLDFLTRLKAERKLAKEGINTYLKDESTEELIKAVISQDIQRIKDVLDETSPNCQNQCGESPLHIAANIGNAEIVKLLARYGAPINVRNNWGDTPLHYGSIFPEVLSALFWRGADRGLRNQEVLLYSEWDRYAKKIKAENNRKLFDRKMQVRKYSKRFLENQK
jgi:hypothetical protein